MFVKWDFGKAAHQISHVCLKIYSHDFVLRQNAIRLGIPEIPLHFAKAHEVCLGSFFFYRGGLEVMITV